MPTTMVRAPSQTEVIHRLFYQSATVDELTAKFSESFNVSHRDARFAACAAFGSGPEAAVHYLVP